VIHELEGDRPSRGRDAWVAPTATVVGEVRLGEEVSIWYGAVLRADNEPITVGARSNIQDNCVVHTDPGFPALVGAGVSVGHAAVLHGCVVEDDVLVGMGAIILNGARIGAGTLVAAGALVLESTVVPPSSLVVGSPGKVRRALGDAERAQIRANAQNYVALAARRRRSAEQRVLP
jgi:carbonic anhydrase/acetyltransferase-like protein (isoleucine patch superfamily)